MSGSSSGFANEALASVRRSPVPGNGVLLKGNFHMRVLDAHGFIKYDNPNIPNGITNQGLAQIYGEVFGATAHITPWYLGLIDGPFTAGDVGDGKDADTMASHANWVEFTEFTGTPNRQTISLDTVATRSLNNSSVVSYTVAGLGAAQEVGGIFVTDLQSATTGGVLFSTAAISTPPTVNNTDVIEVTYTITALASSD